MQIYYPDEEEAGDGQWWSGSVAADMLEPEEAQAAVQDPWSCEGLWERFVVHWAEPPVRGPLSVQPGSDAKSVHRSRQQPAYL